MKPHIQLFLMRHGQAAPPVAGAGDKSRNLDERGRADVRQLGQRLKSLETIPDCVLVSTANRTLQTLGLLTEKWGGIARSFELDRLYLAEPDVYFDLFSEVAPEVERLLIIGHNPGLSDLVEIFVGRAQALPAGCLVRIDFELSEFAHLNSSSKARLGALYLPERG